MKKVLIAILSFVILACAVMSPISASAATKDDVLAEFKKCPASHYIYDDMVQLANNHPLTEEQYDQLLELCKEFNEVFPVDLGKSFHNYTPVQQDQLLSLVKRAAEVLKVTYTVTPVEKDAKHRNDDIITVYDASGKVLYKYDGDLIKKTDEVESTDYALYLAVSVSVMLAAVVVFAFISKKRNKKDFAA